jgi:hypothetical protein
MHTRATNSDDHRRFSVIRAINAVHLISMRVHNIGRHMSGVNDLSIVEIEKLFNLFFLLLNNKRVDKQPNDEIKSDDFTFNKQHSQMKSEIFILFFFIWRSFLFFPFNSLAPTSRCALNKN